MASITLTTKQKRKIKRAIEALNDVRVELQQENPDNYINWYLEDCGNLILMAEETHNDDLNQSANYDAAIEVFHLEQASGGGW